MDELSRRNSEVDNANAFEELPMKRSRQEEDEKVEKSATFVRRKKLKYALLVAYRGKVYHGMQINQDVRTVESVLFDAMRKLDFISEDDLLKPSNFKFQRAARTDKGVSAIRQVCSTLLPLTNGSLEQTICLFNENLPEDVRVFGLIRTTRGFDSKKWCDSRSYLYALPSFCFCRQDDAYKGPYRISEDRLKEVNHILNYYVGTHNFFNFTSGKPYGMESCKRYIMLCECSRLDVPGDVEYLVVSLKGQSFLIHQIRKMIGLCISIIRGHCGEDIMQKVWQSERVRVPTAPALGLVLAEPHFNYYNQRFGTTHQPIQWDDAQEKCEKFWKDYILVDMLETQEREKVFDEWLAYLKDTFWNQEVAEEEEDDNGRTASTTRDQNVEPNTEVSKSFLSSSAASNC